MNNFILVIFLASSSLLGVAYAQEYPELGIKVEVVAQNLEIPWAISFAPDGRIFFTERVGDLRVIENGILNPEPIFSVEGARGEGGLLGLALDPNFEQNHYIYLYYTYGDFFSIWNKVVRYTESDGILKDEKILIDKIPGATYHDGGRIKFGPDNKLYITTGDAGKPDSSQDLSSISGKILRINSDGTIPNDNPFENSMVYSLGHRNPQGIDWDTQGRLVSTEHGPSGERGFAHDEVNWIKKGANYGWPEIVGDEEDSKYISPLIHTGVDTWAPSGAIFYKSDNIQSWADKYLIATLRGNHLRILDMNLDENKIVSSEKVFDGTFGRLRDVSVGPDGNLYLLTSNRDGRGPSTPDDDKILKIMPILATKSDMGDSSLSPKKQLKAGTDPHKISCKENLTLIFKDKVWSPACVKPSSVEKLIQRGWASDHDPKHNMINMRQ